MLDTLVQGHPLHLRVMSSYAAEGVLDAEKPFVQPPELDGTKVQVPLAVVDFGEADVLAAEHVAHVHPVLVPADAPIGAHPPHLVVGGVLERRQPVRIRPRGRPIDGRGRLIRERFVGPLLIVLAAKGVEAALLAPA